MSKTLFAVGCLLVVGATSVRADDAPPEEHPWTPIGIALWDPLGLRGKDDDVSGLSFNLLYGKSHAMTGIEVGTVNFTDRLQGIQLGLIGNYGGHETYAIQGALIFNVIRSGYALQVAGILNGAEKDMTGVQAAILGNLATGDANVVQFGLFNNVEGHFHGLQIGVLNLDGQSFPTSSGTGCDDTGNCGTRYTWTEYPDKRAIGIQLGLANKAQHWAGIQAGAWNAVRYDETGISMGLVNIADELHGAQLGFANISHEVHGLQVGLVNVTRQLHGVQLGALNIATQNRLPFMFLVNAGF